MMTNRQVLARKIAALALLTFVDVTAYAADDVTVNLYGGFKETDAGVEFKRYKSTITLPSIDTGGPDGHGGLGEWWPLGNPGGRFAADFTARINVPSNGDWLFQLGGDDGVYHFVDGTLALAIPGSHSYKIRKVTLPLLEGTHDVEVQFFNSQCCSSRVRLVLPEGVNYVSPSR